MGHKRKPITAVLHLPEDERAILSFEKKIGDFYAAQIEKKLKLLPRNKKLEVLDSMISGLEKQIR